MEMQSHLILATTQDIFRLPCRQTPGLDNAIIVPLPPPPRSADSDNDSDDDDNDDDNDDRGGEKEEEEKEEDIDTERMEIDQRNQTSSSRATGAKKVVPVGDQPLGNGGASQGDVEPTDYTLLLSSVRDRKPCIIRREDGFEKRLLWRCGRCRLIFGYQIYDEDLEELNRSEEESDRKHKGRRQLGNKHYVYILPGGLTTATGMGSLKETDLQLLKED
ncbi:hypothetical protein DRE_07174 [Drechslerella stenobrocha 248]|uniref:STEEP1 domain-containing protein n=1 Tax=Drechslerella stenobrocha 248 TaxID=1043628 RepID=W7HVP0_9PEZI|nr:hypothetical protein DRE_07174 [Drechslerella stenobrocha 248]